VAAVAIIGLKQTTAFSQPRGRLSPHETMTASVAGATITIVYGRPSMRGRTIFGSLVPFNRVWCPGADEATTLESTLPLQIGSVRVPPGPHTVWILPTREAWTLILSKRPSGFHTFYPTNEDLGRVPLVKRELDAPVEQLTFGVEPQPGGGGAISMRWERTEVTTTFTVVR
jgi:hypothetical protein